MRGEISSSDEDSMTDDKESNDTVVIVDQTDESNVESIIAESGNNEPGGINDGAGCRYSVAN